MLLYNRIRCNNFKSVSNKFCLTKLFSSKSERENTIILPFQRIPGPRRYPLIGPLNDLLTLGQPENLHKTIDRLHKQYGSIFRLKIGNVNSIFVSSADYMRSVFLYDGKFPKHPLPPSWVYLNEKYKYKRGLFFMEDEEWLYYRKILNNLVLKDFSRFKVGIERACDNFLLNIETKVYAYPPQSYVQLDALEKDLYRWSIDVLLNVMIGVNQNLDEEPYAVPKNLMNEFSGVVHKIFKLSAQLQSIPPQIADALKIRPWKDFVFVVSETLKLGNDIIEKIIENCPNNDSGLLSQLKNENITDENIKRLFTDLIIAAGDTTSFATQWALYLVAKNEKIQTNIQNQLDNNEGNMETDLIKGTIREMLRLYPTATFIGRFFSKDGSIGPYEVPTNTLALLSLYTAGRDPNHFSNPEHFMPDRWTRNSEFEKDCIFKPQASMPYAIGVRSCIGQKIANYQMHVLLTKILQRYNIKFLCDKDLDTQMKMVMVPHEKLKIGFQLR